MQLGPDEVWCMDDDVLLVLDGCGIIYAVLNLVDACEFF